MLLLKGVVAGLVAIALVIGGVCCALPRQGDVADQTRLYDYVYSGTKSESVDFTTTNMSDDGILTFGTSELYISSPLVNQCPQKVFGESVSGVDMTYVGEAFEPKSLAGDCRRGICAGVEESQSGAHAFAAVVLQGQRSAVEVLVEVFISAVQGFFGKRLHQR